MSLLELSQSWHNNYRENRSPTHSAKLISTLPAHAIATPMSDEPVTPDMHAAGVMTVYTG